MGGGKTSKPKPAKELESGKKEAPKREITKASTTILIDPKVMDQIKKDVVKMKFVTPYQIYSKYNLKYSISKDILETLSKQGLLKAIKSGRRLDIYVPAA
ncbi:MAG: 30S ribosomal protein S25e [Candidatus Methanomethyliales bacterium]|nr:30S ribosomal protein S25e [Candidatus Methanomethylicales archaeon]